MRPDAYSFGFNVGFDFNTKLSTVNSGASRFNAAANFQQYIKGINDVAYLLDGVEKAIIFRKDMNDKKYFFTKLISVSPEFKTVMLYSTNITIKKLCL